jgi:acetyl-CoA synthetase
MDQSTNSYPVPAEFAARAHVDAARYAADYARSVRDPAAFWDEIGRRLDWIRPYSKVKDVSYRLEDFHIRWYEDGTLNVSHNCLDRHLAERADRVAILWEGDRPGESRRVTYRELHADVCRFGNVLRDLGVRKGDRVTIYLPMIPEAAVAMLACSRIGAIHSVIFAGFSPESIASRIEDCGSRIVITSDEAWRGGKTIPLKRNVDAAIALRADSPVDKVVVVRRTGASVSLVAGRDVSYEKLMAGASTDCAPEEMGAEDPLFILYTSGSTGKPKGVLHTTGGYLVFASYTFQDVFDYRDEDIYWCTADVGWVTGHSYVVYGPLSVGATTLMFEGTPKYPDPGRFWQVCDKYQVSILYTSPTAIRSLVAEG